jgi:hypothetical protein
MLKCVNVNIYIMCIKMLKFMFYVCMYVMYDVYFPISSFFVIRAVVDVHNFQCFVIFL